MTYLVPEGIKGGEYIAKVDDTYPNGQVPQACRKFYVNEFRELELKVTVDFNQDKYTSGEKVEVKIKVRKPDGTKLQPRSTVNLHVAIPGETSGLSTTALELNEQGETKTSFELPSNDFQSASLILKTFLGGGGPPVVTSHTVPILHIEKLNIKTYSDMVLLEGSFNPRKESSYLIPNIQNTLFMQTDDELEFQHA